MTGRNPDDDHCHRHLIGVVLHIHGGGEHWHLDGGPAGATLLSAGWPENTPDYPTRHSAGAIAGDAMASAELAGRALGPAFRRVLARVATGELTVDEAIRIARRDLESDLASTLDVGRATWSPNGPRPTACRRPGSTRCGWE